MYSLVQFKDNDGGTLSIVNSEWLTPRKNEVYWPPVKGTKAFERLLTCSPNEKWHLYGVQRVFCETDSLEKAKQKLKLAEVTSDLTTEEKTEVQRPTKRRAIRTNRYISSDEQDDENDNYILLQDKNKYPGASLPNNLEQGFLTNVENKRQETDDLQLTGFQDEVVSLLTLIKIQNDQILSILKHKRMGVNLKPDYKFPLKTNEDLENTEKLLKIEENYENLVSYLETLGGRDTSNKVSRIMKTLLADGLSKEFNFYGKRSQKRPFCQLLLRKCIVEAVIKNTTGATEKEIEDKIKVWLKHAPERVLKKENKVD
ncbi:hypothetical protein ACJJTC_009426 [Scirpophaga incertulas]